MPWKSEARAISRRPKSAAEMISSAPDFRMCWRNFGSWHSATMLGWRSCVQTLLTAMQQTIVLPSACSPWRSSDRMTTECACATLARRRITSLAGVALDDVDVVEGGFVLLVGQHDFVG